MGRAHKTDLALGLAGAAFGLASIAFPYGRDQGLYHYVGREWVHGRLPYRDAFDVKTPGIYLVHALLVSIFGEQRIWPIRLAELVATIGLGALVARLADPARELSGSRGLGILAACVAYYGYFDYWDTGQCEIWCSVFCAAGVLAARHRIALLAGLLFGVSALFKPPSLVFSLFAVAFLLRAPSVKRAILDIAVAAVGGLVPIVVLAVYFRSASAWNEMYDVVVVNNRHYVVEGRWVQGASDIVMALPDRLRGDSPLSFILLNASAVLAWRAWRVHDMDALARHGGALVAFALVLVAVTAQLKFCNYHWGLWIGPTVFAVVSMTRDLTRHRSMQTPALAGAACLLGVFFVSGDPLSQWWLEQRAMVEWIRGRTDSATYHAAFTTQPAYSWERSVAIARDIEARASENDTLAVRGFEPQIYILSRRRYTGRFFWSTFLVVPSWSYRIADWREEDLEAFAKDPPRFVVAIDHAGDPIDAAQTYEALGYRRIGKVDDPLVLLEKK